MKFEVLIVEATILKLQKLWIRLKTAVRQYTVGQVLIAN